VRIKVDLKERSYSIEIESGLLKDAGIMLAPKCRGRAVILTHPILTDYYGDNLRLSLADQGIDTDIIQAQPGERSKRLQTAERIYRQLAQGKYDRNTLLITLGGGVVGDLGGFVASTYLRGISFIQIPTTLLAQVDASIGGKVGLDLPDGKNLVGAFYQPQMVIIDPSTLKTLPIRHLRSGLAEVIKYGLILDAELFNSVESVLDRLLTKEADMLSSVICECCRLKAQLVSEDERDISGSRARLNFGHTFGHAVEKALDYRLTLHGEAVAMGMVAAARLGIKLGVTPPTVEEEIRDLLNRAGLPVRLPKSLTVDAVLDAMRHDKKAETNKLNFVLLERIGASRLVLDVPEQAVRETAKELIEI
jgi:3-dehydroquinate synthase